MCPDRQDLFNRGVGIWGDRRFHTNKYALQTNARQAVGDDSWSDGTVWFELLEVRVDDLLTKTDLI